MADHTPGPWHHSETMWACATTKPDGQGDAICTCHNTDGCSDDVVMANARLIASAPSLLLQLERLVSRATNCLYGPEPHGKEARDRLDEAINDSLSLICELNGGTP